MGERAQRGGEIALFDGERTGEDGARSTADRLSDFVKDDGGKVNDTGIHPTGPAPDSHLGRKQGKAVGVLRKKLT